MSQDDGLNDQENPYCKGCTHDDQCCMSEADFDWTPVDETTKEPVMDKIGWASVKVSKATIETLSLAAVMLWRE